MFIKLLKPSYSSFISSITCQTLSMCLHWLFASIALFQSSMPFEVVVEITTFCFLVMSRDELEQIIFVKQFMYDALRLMIFRLLVEYVHEKCSPFTHCIHFGSALYYSPLIWFLADSKAPRFQLFTFHCDYIQLLRRLKLILFAKFGCVFIHEFSGMCFQLVNTGKWLCLRWRISLLGLIDSFGQQDLLVIIGLCGGLIFDALASLPTEVLFLLREGRSKQKGGAQLSLLFPRFVHTGMNCPASFDLLSRHTLFILCRNIKIIATNQNSAHSCVGFVIVVSPISKYLRNCSRLSQYFAVSSRVFCWLKQAPTMLEGRKNQPIPIKMRALRDWQLRKKQILRWNTIGMRLTKRVAKMKLLRKLTD